MAVVKNNAYGHGLKEISEYLDRDERVIYLVVNNIKEALYLRNNNIKKDILILGNVEANDLPLIKDRNLTISIKNSRFKIEYNYDNLIGGKDAYYDHHIYWRYKYLHIEPQGKKEKQAIQKSF